jgi:hypothetical protein
MALAVMVQGAAIFQGNADHRFLRSSSCLVNGFWHFARLAMSKAYATLAIAHNYQCSKTKALTALNCLRNAVDVDELLDRAIIFFLSWATIIVVTTTATAATATTIVTAATTAATATLAFRSG